MSSTNKYRILFVAICLFIGFAIYMNSGTPTEDLDPKVLNMENIERVEIKRVSDDKVITLNDMATRQLIEDLLSSKKTKIKDPRYSRGDYYLKIFFLDKKILLFGFQESKSEGKFFWGDGGYYQNDSLYFKLSKLEFY